uniref:Ovule protein n=1 Tax=Parascaris equorum TaxID=6256 RepID=A0A914RAV0_PAREQ
LSTSYILTLVLRRAFSPHSRRPWTPTPCSRNADDLSISIITSSICASFILATSPNKIPVSDETEK